MVADVDNDEMASLLVGMPERDGTSEKSIAHERQGLGDGRPSDWLERRPGKQRPLTEGYERGAIGESEVVTVRSLCILTVCAFSPVSSVVFSMYGT